MLFLYCTEARDVISSIHLKKYLDIRADRPFLRMDHSIEYVRFEKGSCRPDYWTLTAVQ